MRTLCLHDLTTPVDAHTPLVATDHFNHAPVVTGTVPPALPARSREIGRSVMESTECGESVSDLGQGIIDTACVICAAGSDKWVNYKNLLVLPDGDGKLCSAASRGGHLGLQLNPRNWHREVNVVQTKETGSSD